VKKIFLTLFVFLIAYQAQAENFYNYCSVNTAKKTFTGSIASFSGFNLLTRNIAENKIKKTIKKETNSKFKIKINNFFASNILNGEIKSIKATSKKYDYDGIHLTNMNITSICPYNRINFEDNKLYFVENMVLKYNVFLTEDDLNKTISSQKIDKRISSILKKASKYGLLLPLAKNLKSIAIPIKIDENNNAILYINDIKTAKDKIELTGHIVILKNK